VYTSMGKASSEIGMLYSSSQQHAGAAAALLGLGCITVYNVNPVCMQLLACNEHLVHLQAQVCRVNTPVSMLKQDGHHPS
jgi:hypothetical protein